jgi:serine/threonine-protein kinase
MAAAKAKATLHRAGLTGREGAPAYSETVPKGEVLRTDPEPGSRVLDHGTVTLVLSLGKERYAVPDLAGRTEDQAQDALLATHLTFGQSTSRWSESVPEGSVIASTPAPGVRLRRDTAVDLVVSKGPKPIRVADWTGRSAQAATRALEGKGLVVTRDEDIYSDTVDAGDVVSQSPSTGTLHRGDEVRLTVSKGPELVAIPDDLVASGVDAAQAELEGLGFTVRLEKSMTYLGLGYVMSVDPGEGSMAPKGSTVTLKLV